MTRRHPAHGGPARAGSQAGHARPGMIRGTGGAAVHGGGGGVDQASSRPRSEAASSKVVRWRAGRGAARAPGGGGRRTGRRGQANGGGRGGPGGRGMERTHSRGPAGDGRDVEVAPAQQGVEWSWARVQAGGRGACAGGAGVDRGEVVHDLGRRVDPVSDRVEVDGSRVVLDERRRYWLLNKPSGVVSTAADPEGRPTVVGMVPEQPRCSLWDGWTGTPKGSCCSPTTGPGLPSHPRQVRDRETVPGRGRPPARRRPGPPAQGGGARGWLRQANPGQGGGRLRSSPHGRGRHGRGAQPGGAAVAGRGRRPVRRLVRTAVGPVRLTGLAPGEFRPCAPRRSGASTRQQDYEEIRRSIDMAIIGGDEATADGRPWARGGR